MSNVDLFGDIIGNETGIFSGDGGLKAHEGVQHQYSQDGVEVELHCTGPRHGGCGKPKHVTILWHEIVALKFNVSPHEAYRGNHQLMSTWAPTRRPQAHGWYPTEMTCDRCGEMVAPIVEPRECEGHLRKARHNGWLPPQAEQQLQHASMGVARSLGRIPG